MKIGIDARLINQTGVGRYIRNLLANLAQIDSENSYTIYLNADSYTDFMLPNERWEKRLVNIPWHTTREQIILPRIYLDDNLNLLHVPYHNAPIFYPGKMVITVHDLTILKFATGRASTHNKFIYKIKHTAYRMVTKKAVKKACSIIAVSNSTKKDIMKYFMLKNQKINVIYEGVDIKFAGNIKKQISGDYFLYVGNAYPHKNISTLIAAYSKFIKSRENNNIKLVLAGPNDYFFNRLKRKVNNLNLSERIVFAHRINDNILASLYKHAICLVFPSFSEGFGLPALEALSFKTNVICSDIPVFREILGRNARFFDPYNINSVADSMTEALKFYNNKKLFASDFFIRNIKNKYSWEKMAKDTLSIYSEC